jgi:DNA transformation protein
LDSLAELPNIGPVLAAKLNAIGVSSDGELADLGAVEAVLRIGQTDRAACYNMLYALEGAIQRVRWHQLPKAERAQLKKEFDTAFEA